MKHLTNNSINLHYYRIDMQIYNYFYFCKLFVKKLSMFSKVSLTTNETPPSQNTSVSVNCDSLSNSGTLSIEAVFSNPTIFDTSIKLYDSTSVSCVSIPKCDKSNLFLSCKIHLIFKNFAPVMLFIISISLILVCNYTINF